MTIKKFYKINHQITAEQVRTVDEAGKQIGILSISLALKKAQEVGVDLVEIAPNAKPPVVKIIDFAKFKYLEDKKQKEARKHTRETELKEVRFSPFIGEHDFETALSKVKRFIKEGDLVRITVRFKGAQMAHQEFGPKLLSKILANLEGIARQERPERFEGRQLVTVVKPIKAKPKEPKIINQEQKEDENETKNQESSG